MHVYGMVCVQCIWSVYIYTRTSPRSRSHRSAADIPYTDPIYTYSTHRVYSMSTHRVYSMSMHRVYSMSTPICK